MKKLRALIVDDEELARRGLEIRLEAIDDIQICGMSRNGREALEAISELHPDVVFLDIQMPGMNGFDVLRAIAGPTMPVVIFVTAFDRYAIKAFEANALDYLLKPIDETRLAEAVARARSTQVRKEATAHTSRLLKLICDLTGKEMSLDEALERTDGEVAARYPARLAIRDGRETVCVDVSAIDWIEAAGDYMCVHANGSTHVLRGTMKRLEKILDPELFVRVHRSTIVNRNRVRSMRPHINGEYFLQLDGNKEVKLSRNYKTSVARIADTLNSAGG